MSVPSAPEKPDSGGSASRSRSLWLGTVFILILGVTGGGLWYWGTPKRLQPPMPDGIEDAEVLEVITNARQKVLQSPRSAAEWGFLGQVFLAHLFDREADTCLAEAARLDPDDPRWPYARAVIALKRDPDNAMLLLRTALAVAGEAWPEYRSVIQLQLAEALLERQQLDEAGKLFREEQRRNPRNARAALGLGLIASAKGNKDEATQQLTAARSSQFARKLATAQLALLSRAQGNKAEAEYLERESSELSTDPPWPDPLLDKVVEMQVGRRGTDRKIELLEQQQRFEDVVQLYLRQIETKPTARAYVGAGVNLARLKDYQRAMPLLREGLRLDPESANANYTLALVLYIQAEKALAVSPEDAQAKKWLEEVIEHAKRATEKKRDHGRAYLFWGLALLKLGKPGEALEPLRMGVSCLPAHFELQLALGEALLEAGKGNEAQRYLQNAARLEPKDARPRQALERWKKTKK